MSATRMYGQIIFACDEEGCEESLETGENEFSDGLRKLQAGGWRSRKLGKEWRHFCAQCLAQASVRNTRTWRGA